MPSEENIIGSAENQDPTPTEQSPSYLTMDQFNNGFNSLKGDLDKRTTQINSQYEALQGKLSALDPLMNLLQAQNQQNTPDPILTRPIDALRDVSGRLPTLEEKLRAQEEAITRLVNTQTGFVYDARINEAYAKDFHSKDDLTRAKALSISDRYSGLYAACIRMENNDPVAGFGRFKEILVGSYSNDPEVQPVAQSLLRAKAMQASFNNSSAASGGGGQGQNPKQVSLNGLNF